jgi:hypothetical protein
MKSGLLILAVVAIMTGVAGDLMVGPSRPFPRIEARVQPVLSPSLTTSDPVGRADAVETRRQPVPLLLANRTSIASRPVDSDTALANDTPLSQMAESAAKAAIEADGYRAVRILQKATGGEWRARALRGATEVSLSVDVSGNVSVD